MRPGDHVKTSRIAYTHHGIYVRHNHVIEYGGGLKGSVSEVTASEFSKGRSIEVVKHPDRRYSRRETVERARSRLMESDYNLAFQNCEHFVNWCIEGEAKSSQVRNAAKGVLQGVAGVATAYFVNG